LKPAVQGGFYGKVPAGIMDIDFLRGAVTQDLRIYEFPEILFHEYA